MKKIFILLIAIIAAFSVSAQQKKAKYKKKKHIKVVYATDTNRTIPDSITKLIKLASDRVLKDVEAKNKKSSDSVMEADVWCSYNSIIQMKKTQVTIHITAYRVKQKNKMVTRNYYIRYQCEHDLFDISYDKSLKKPSVHYNESYWPGFMYTEDKGVPKKNNLNQDIARAMREILKNGVRWN